jgi:PAS domain S-box-containing protein
MNFAHNLFLLMFSLSQLHSRPKIIELFVDGMNNVFIPLKFNYMQKKHSENDVEIKTRSSLFGFIGIDNKSELSDENRSLIQNAVQMLAVILERLVFDEELRQEKLSIEKIAEERHKELQQTIAELEKTRNASLNLIEDLSDEVEKRKQSEKELKESEERFRGIFNSTSESILIHDARTGEIRDCNNQALFVYGYDSKAELLGVNIGSISAENEQYNQEKALELIDKANEEGNISFEWLSKRKNGELFWCEISLKSASIGGKKRIISVIRDITTKKQDETILRESEERFSTAFRASPAPLVISDIESGLFVDVNDRWVEMLGYTREEQIGKTSKEVGIWHDPSERDRVIQQVLKNGFFKDEYIEFKTKSGEIILALWSAETIMQSGKKLMLSMIHDITARVKAERELRRLKENLEVEVEQKTQELRQRITELERFQNATIEREYRIKELRDEIKYLKNQIIDVNHDTNQK